MHLNKELRKLGDGNQRIMGEEDVSIFDSKSGEVLLNEVAALASAHTRGLVR